MLVLLVLVVLAGRLLRLIILNVNSWVGATTIAAAAAAAAAAVVVNIRSVSIINVAVTIVVVVIIIVGLLLRVAVHRSCSRRCCCYVTALRWCMLLLRFWGMG